ncbi:unnamed protein product [Victoria cruziana]
MGVDGRKSGLRDREHVVSPSVEGPYLVHLFSLFLFYLLPKPLSFSLLRRTGESTVCHAIFFSRHECQDMGPLLEILGSSLPATLTL